MDLKWTYDTRCVGQMCNWKLLAISNQNSPPPQCGRRPPHSCCCSTRRAEPPDPQARGPLSAICIGRRRGPGRLLLFNTTRTLSGPPSTGATISRKPLPPAALWGNEKAVPFQKQAGEPGHSALGPSPLVATDTPPKTFKAYRVACALFSPARLISEASLPVFHRGWGRISTADVPCFLTRNLKWNGFLAILAPLDTL